MRQNTQGRSLLLKKGHSHRGQEKFLNFLLSMQKKVGCEQGASCHYKQTAHSMYVFLRQKSMYLWRFN